MPSSPVRVLPLVLVSLLVLGAAPLAAQEDADTGVPDTIEMKPIEVWYTQEQSQARSAESIAVFTSREMRHSAEISPYEFFKHVNGVNLVQGHALGFGLRNPVAGRLQIRGIGRKAGVDMAVRGVLLLMDGVPDFSVTHGHPLPDIFSRSYVDEIEVIKGPSSVRYGWGQAGVILMRSKDPQQMGTSGYAAGSGGTFGTTQDLLDYNYRWGDGFLQVSGALRRTDGDRPNSATEAHDGRIRYAQKMGGVNVIASVRGGHNDWEIPGPVGGDPGVGGRNNWYVADVGARGKAGAWDLTGKVWRFDARVKFEDGLHEPNDAWGIRTKAERTPWENGHMLLGLDVMNYRNGRGKETITRTDFQTEVAPYVWLNEDLGRWILSGGLRYTHNEQFGQDVSPEAGIVFRPVRGTALRAHVSHGFRAPNPFDFAFGSTANPDLKATDLWQYELGWNQRVANAFQFDVVGWVQDGSNMIVSEFDPAVQDVRKTNSGAFTHKGVEAQAEYADARGWRFGVAGNVMDLQDDTALVPLKTVDFWVGYEPSPWGVRIEGRHAMDRYQKDAKQVPLGDYTEADLRTWYRFPTGIGLRLEVENLGDQHYELFKGWPMPGRAVYAGVDYVF